MKKTVKKFIVSFFAIVSAVAIAFTTPSITPDGKITTSNVIEVDAATTSLRNGVSWTAASGNLSAKSFPACISSAYVGDSVYGNAAVNSTEYVKSFTFQVKKPGSSSFVTYATDTATNYMRYAYERYTFSAAGTYEFRVIAKFTNGSSVTSSSVKVTVTSRPAVTTTSSIKYTDFTGDSRWKIGKTWNGSQTPLIGQKGFKGCAALCSDWAKYKYGKNVTAGSTYNSVGSIKAGDIIKMYYKGTTSQHWIIVVGRNSNGTLKVLEGNWDSKIVYTDGTYKISGNYLTRGNKTFQIVTGYHYN